MDYAIEAEGLVKDFDATRALDGVDLAVRHIDRTAGVVHLQRPEDPDLHAHHSVKSAWPRRRASAVVAGRREW